MSYHSNMVTASQIAYPMPDPSIQLSHKACRDFWSPIAAANSTTFHTSQKELAMPRLIRVTPSSRPTMVSKSLGSIPRLSLHTSSLTPSMAAAPPGLHIQPVRREIFFFEALYSMKALGIISPEGWNFFCCSRSITSSVSGFKVWDAQREKSGTRWSQSRMLPR